jgi:hypothetical protein
MFATWEIWEEINARVLCHHASPVHFIITRVKEDSRLWSIARGKTLSNVIS